MDLGQLFDTFTAWAFRLERLAAYRVPEEESVLALFARNGVVPDGFNSEWAALVRSATESGRQVKRLRLVSDGELTPYERFELAAYGPGIAAGEQIRVDRRSSHPTTGDFWLFDGEWKASMNYAPAGEFTGATVTQVRAEDPDVAYWLRAYEQADRELAHHLE